jgi:PAS domain S-box-containing protein
MENSTNAPSQKLQVSYELLFEKNPLPMWVYDVQTLGMLAVNEAALALYGYDKHEFVGLTLLDLYHDDHAEQVQTHVEQPLGVQPEISLWQHMNREGQPIEVETVTQDIHFEGVHARMVRVTDRTEQHRAEQSLMDLTHRLTTTLESISDAFFTLDLDYRFTYVNNRAEEILRHPRQAMLGCSIWEVFPEALGTAFQTEAERAMTQAYTSSFESFYAPFGRWMAVDVYPSVQGLAVYFRDVTERHEANQRLQEEQETLSAVVNTTTDAIISIDHDGRIKLFNPGAERIFRRSRESMLGQSVEVLLPERFRAAHLGQRRFFAETGVSSRMMGLGMVKGLRSDGLEVDLEVTISQIAIRQKKMMIANLRDVSARVRADAAFQETRARLSDLTQRLMTQERVLVKRLAQSLHDQLGQTLAALRMAHETQVDLQPQELSPAMDRLQGQIGTLIGQAIRQVRQVLMDLRPPLLEEQGLAAALDNELRNRSLTQPEIDISIHVQPDVAVLRWPTEVEYAAFMVAREAVENSFRHSGASSVAVRLTGSPSSLDLHVTDNGGGMKVDKPARSGHLGILGMHERAQAIGATVTMSPGEAGGTRVAFRWKSAP